MQLNQAAYEALSPEKRELADKLLQAHREILEQNPLEGFHACPEWCGSPQCPSPKPSNPTGGRPKQHEFMTAPELVVASNAGNRFGKTTGMVVWAIIQHTPDGLLPDRLKIFKRPRGTKAQGRAVQGRYMCESEEWFEDNALPVFKLWTPRAILRDGAWDKAYRKHPGNVIHFADGGQMSVPTYKKDPQALSGWSGDYVLWDEPPPESHWREGGLIRVMDREGCHRFGMTPVNMKGGGIGWVKRRIFDRGNPAKDDYNPNFRIVRASIHDNPDYSTEQIEQTLSEYPDDERQAREFGDFIHFGGMIYPGGFEQHLKPEPEPKQLEGHDIYVGIDPGLKNAAFVWAAFDNDNVAFVFDERLVQEGTAIEYAKAIRETNSKWQLREPPVFVIDPSARNRSLINAESIEAELARQGIYCMHGQNQVQAGVQQVRRRLTEKGLYFSEKCSGLRDEADEYRMEDRPDGEFKVVKENDHRLDALRYLLMSRPWYAVPDVPVNDQPWVPGMAPNHEWLVAHAPGEPETPLFMS